ncbi:MAG: peptidylprolyl isomerase [Chthoniobacteraceae bacterium]
MYRPPRWKALSAILTTFLVPAAVSFVIAQGPANTPPTIDDLLKEGAADKVIPSLPVGKALVIPVAASDADGDALSYTVTSSNSKIHVRARTAQPHLKLAVRHASSGGQDPAFEGELEFQVLREWTPETAGFINGFAQSNYWLPRAEGSSTRHTIFHRVVKDFMAQTGDPNGHTRNQKDAEDETIPHGPGFNFNDEFHPGLIFTGRGQMAMANAGFDGVYNGTNNSQWFVTMGPQRHLDFNHSIFGQLIRGWEILDQMNNVLVQDQPTRTDIPAGTPDSPEQNSSPIAPIEITGSTVVPNLTDAVLVITAEGPGTSTITVKVDDGKGGVATRTMTVTAADDEHNSPPFLAQFPSDGPLSAKNGEAFPLQALDLENDYLFLNSNTLTGDAISQVAGNTLQVFPLKFSGSNSTAPTTGKHLIGMTVGSFDMAGIRSGGTDDQRSTTFVIGEKAITAESLPISGTPGVALTAAVASFSDADARGDKSGYGARINWGDGTTPALVASSDIIRDPSKPSLVAYQVKGTHTYARPGTYTIKVNLESTTGLKKTVFTVAVISADPVKVFGEALNASDGKVSNQIVATIEDSAPEAPSAYSARVNWGDGTVTPGVVKRAGNGQLYVAGSHTYEDNDSFSVQVDVTKAGAATPVTGWATVRAVNRNASRYLPPFARARVISDIVRVSTKKGTKPLLTTVGSNLNEQTMATLGVVVISQGARTIPPSKIRFYLSADRTLNLADEEYEDLSVEPPVTRINPKDIRITVGKKKGSLKINALKPGVG